MDATSACNVLDQLIKLVGKPDCENDPTPGSLHTAMSNRFEELLKETDNRKVVAQLFRATVSREPTAAEFTAIEQQLAADPRDAVFSDLLWALLNSKEFAFNH
jgi:hypothetical protein